MCSLQVKAAYKNYWQLQTQTEEVAMMDGKCLLLTMELRYQNAGQAHFTHFAAVGFLDLSLHNNSSLWPMPLMLQSQQWDSDLVEARYIKDIEDNLSIIRLRFGDNSKPLFRNREFIVYERRETMEDGTLVVAVASLPKEIAAGLHPKQNNAIRGLLLQSGWVVDKLEDDSCVVTYVVQLDPAGWLPKCFVNRLNTKLVMIIENLRKLAQTACPVEGEN
ncbi:uncharacterized protein LOC130716091 isoform X2 [Lotus japonicus]|uniref:uncharacterized protein LOC130716091 isoform X2 n=1 Tax=Lotus japonicus TaxID=34305 RepID=UPI0025838898|nr:uncharacterized protein LOC130716091 isoform X2 [Lotus japonicus]